MFDIIQSETFEAWISDLRDKRAVAKINARLRRASLGNLGDVAPVGSGVSEMRIHYGPATASISSGSAESLSLCCVPATRKPKPPILRTPFASPKHSRTES